MIFNINGEDIITASELVFDRDTTENIGYYNENDELVDVTYLLQHSKLYNHEITKINEK